MTVVPLPEAPLNAPLEVRAVAPSPLGRRLVTLGLEPGAPLSVMRRAPLGGPLLLAFSGSRLALRRDEAALVTVAVGPSSERA